MLGFVVAGALGLVAPAQEAPPGLVFVKGGKTWIGSTVDEVEKLVLAREELRNAVAGETPQHAFTVGDFFLMPTEVTNEQYVEFVKATGAPPPRSWGTKALQAGQAAFLEEQGAAKQAAKAAGLPFESKTFDSEAWWEENWKEAHWEIPAGSQGSPVVFVSHADALAYARWAGLRLMTEEEFVRAGRGDGKSLYPWGDNWDDRKYCHSVHVGKDEPATVGSYPEGSLNGIHDLCGNVWEWTSSPFDAFPGYEAIKVKAQKRTIECLAPFDPDQRVTVSGSYHSDRVGVRLATRRPTDRDQATNALGFRCAASPTPGLDTAAWIVNRELKHAVMGIVEIDPSNPETPPAILRRWSTTEGTVKLPGYAVIREYEQVLACSVKNIRALNPSEVAAKSLTDGPVFLGFVDVPRPLMQPELDAGTFLIAFRGAGPLEEVKAPIGIEDPVVPLDQVPGFVAEKDCYILYTTDGTPQAAIDALPVTIDKARATSLKIEPFVPPDPKTAPRDAQPTPPLDTLRITFAIPSASSKGKDFLFDVPLKVAPGALPASFK